MPIVTLVDIHKSFGSEVVFEGLNQRFYPGEKVGLIGPNGSGKTTLLKLILGASEPDVGKVINRKGLRIGYLPQEPSFRGSSTIIEQMHAGLEGVLSVQRKMQITAERFGELSGPELKASMAEYERLSRQFELAGGYAYETKVSSVLAGLGFGEQQYTAKTSSLSGGQL
jgi:ATP-binding cassette subfamily F protein 3